VEDGSSAFEHKHSHATCEDKDEYAEFCELKNKTGYVEISQSGLLNVTDCNPFFAADDSTPSWWFLALGVAGGVICLVLVLGCFACRKHGYTPPPAFGKADPKLDQKSDKDEKSGKHEELEELESHQSKQKGESD